MAIANSFDILQAVIEATSTRSSSSDLDALRPGQRGIRRFIGKSQADIVGKNDFELDPEADARAFVEADRRVLASGQHQAFEA